MFDVQHFLGLRSPRFSTFLLCNLQGSLGSTPPTAAGEWGVKLVHVQQVLADNLSSSHFLSGKLCFFCASIEKDCGFWCECCGWQALCVSSVSSDRIWNRSFQYSATIRTPCLNHILTHAHGSTQRYHYTYIHSVCICTLQHFESNVYIYICIYLSLYIYIYI